MVNIIIPPWCHMPFPPITCFDMKVTHERIQTTSSHASHCHHCHHFNVDFVLFHNVTCCTNSPLSCILSAQNPHPWVRPSPGGVQGLTCHRSLHNISMCDSNNTIGISLHKTHNSYSKNTRSQVFRNTQVLCSFCKQLTNQVFTPPHSNSKLY